MAGGYRPGSGAKKNQHRIAAGELRKALEAKLGIPYVEMLAETQVKLFQDFKNDVNVKEYIRFTENMSARLLENNETQVSITDNSDLTRDQIQDRINNLLARKALSEGATTTPAVADASQDCTKNSESQ